MAKHHIGMLVSLEFTDKNTIHHSGPFKKLSLSNGLMNLVMIAFGNFK